MILITSGIAEFYDNLLSKLDFHLEGHGCLASLAGCLTSKPIVPGNQQIGGRVSPRARLVSNSPSSSRYSKRVILAHDLQLLRHIEEM